MVLPASLVHQALERFKEREEMLVILGYQAHQDHVETPVFLDPRDSPVVLDPKVFFLCSDTKFDKWHDDGYTVINQQCNALFLSGFTRTKR